MKVLVTVLVGVSLAACNGSGSSSTENELDAGTLVCTPGEKDGCICFDGYGEKTCLSDGSGWGECDCCCCCDEEDDDTELDTNSDCNYDAGVEFATDAGPWEWEDNPEGEDCGTGCTQLTFGQEVRREEWDVWGNLIVFWDGIGHTVKVVDIDSNRTMRIPDVHPEYPITDDNFTTAAYTYNPVIETHTIYYVLFLAEAEPMRDEIVWVDLHAKSQTIAWSRCMPASEPFDGFKKPDNLDASSSWLVSRGGAGDPMHRTLSVYSPPWPTEGVAIIDDFYGYSNSLWGDNLVFFREEGRDIMGYNLAEESFFPVIEDSEEQHDPRIHGNRVVYMDLRLGDSTLEGFWSNAAVFMFDLNTKERKQVTSGEWIAAYPDVYGDVVVWLDYRDCEDPNNKNDGSGIEVWGYNLMTDVSAQVTDLPGRIKTHVRIWEDKVFVHMFFEETWGHGIYLFDLPDELKSP